MICEGMSRFEIFPLLSRAHSEVPRFHQRGEESRVEAQIPSQCARDPSLRLKNGFARDDALTPRVPARNSS